MRRAANRTALAGALIAGLLLATASPVRAQQSMAHEAVLELRVESADVVVRGTVLAVQRREAGNLHDVLVTVRVLETIKGETRSTLEFTESEISDSNVWSIFKETYYNSWRTAGHEFVWFLRKPAAGQSVFLPWTDYLTVRSQIPLVEDVAPLTPAGYSSLFPNAHVTADLRVLRNPDAILAAVHAAAAFKPLRRGECLAPVPWDKAPGCGVGVPPRMIVRPGDGYVQYLHLPVDERMEALCHRMIQRPEELWTIPTANPWSSWEVPASERQALVRENGVRCLQAFRSQGNVALLKSVANERLAPRGQPNPVDANCPSFGWCDAAKAATEVLASWGMTTLRARWTTACATQLRLERRVAWSSLRQY